MINSRLLTSTKIVRIISQLIALLLLVGVIGVFLEKQVDSMVSHAVEKNVAAQTAGMSVLVDELFNRELSSLNFIASYISHHPATSDTEDLLTELRGSADGLQTGFLSVSGKTVTGYNLNPVGFSNLSTVFRGIPVVEYSAGRGLLFAVPVFRGFNVRGAVFKLYEDHTLPKLLQLTRTSNGPMINIAQRNGSMILPYQGFSNHDRKLLQSEQFKKGFAELRERMKSAVAAAIYSDGPEGRYFLFGADLPDTNCIMLGYSRWEDVAGRLATVQYLLLMVGGLILLMLVLGCVVVFVLQIRSLDNLELKQAREIADRANQAKSDFLAHMSHEFRTPINVVLGMNEMILRETRDDAVRGYAQNIARAGKSFLEQVNEILDISKIEAGRLDIVPVRYSLGDLLTEIEVLTRSRAEEAGLTFTLSAAEDLPAELTGDEIQVRHVMVNLLSNALKYTRQGEISLSVTLDAQKTKDDSVRIRFAVADTGCGIRQEDLSTLFDKFTRFDMSRNRHIEGTGLGLAICVRLAKLMGGTLEVQSEYGKGSVFTLSVPQQAEGSDTLGSTWRKTAAMKSQKAMSLPVFTAPKARVLAVDDQEMNLMVLSGLLKQNLIVPDTCSGGKACLQKLRTAAYDVVLLDHMMPDIDGIETMKLIREQNLSGSCRFIVVTANAIAGARQQYLESGFDDYLSKPVDYRQMEALLLRYLPEDKVTLCEASESPKDTENDASPGVKAVNSISKAKDEEQKRGAKINRPGSSGTEAKDSADSDTDLSEHSVFDPECGLGYCGQMPDMYVSMLRLFCGQREQKCAELEELLGHGDYRGYVTQVHALKSSSLTIGAARLSACARALESAGKLCMELRDGDPERHIHESFISEHHQELLRLYKEATACAEGYLEENQASG